MQANFSQRSFVLSLICAKWKRLLCNSSDSTLLPDAPRGRRSLVIRSVFEPASYFYGKRVVARGIA